MENVKVTPSKYKGSVLAYVEVKSEHIAAIFWLQKKNDQCILVNPKSSIPNSNWKSTHAFFLNEEYRKKVEEFACSVLAEHS